MTIAVLISATVTLLVSLVCLAALVEMYVQLESIRQSIGLKSGGPVVEVVEEVIKTVIARPPSDVGLHVPAGKPAWYVLFVSAHCATCHRILEALAEKGQVFLSIVGTLLTVCLGLAVSASFL